MPVQVIGLDRFVQHCASVAKEAKTLDERVVKNLAAGAKATILATASPKHLSRFNNGKGLTLNARYVLTTENGEPTARVFPTPTGVWNLLEFGTKAHQIGFRVSGGPGKRGRRNQIGFLGSASRGFAAIGPVMHPETASKHTWTVASDAALAGSQAIFASTVRPQYVKMFAG